MFDGIPVGTSSMPKHFTTINFPNGTQVHSRGHRMLRDTESHRTKTSNLRKTSMAKELGTACEKRKTIHQNGCGKGLDKKIPGMVFFFFFCLASRKVLINQAS